MAHALFRRSSNPAPSSGGSSAPGGGGGAGGGGGKSLGVLANEEADSLLREVEALRDEKRGEGVSWGKLALMAERLPVGAFMRVKFFYQRSPLAFARSSIFLTLGVAFFVPCVLPLRLFFFPKE